MATHQIEVVIPEDRRLVIEVPETIHSGPATLIFVTPSESQAEAEERPESVRRAARTRWQEMRAELAGDPRPFRQLSPEERRDRLQRLQGIGRGLLSSSEEFARNKAEEIEIEERSPRPRGEEVCPLKQSTSSMSARPRPWVLGNGHV
ncbi:MAG TPA: hypothetical protein VEW48_21820 [Thermoanaerobaculia bacterium]|nr:hypothetical protein [Thermoanaerobaculia bacterium]